MINNEQLGKTMKRYYYSDLISEFKNKSLNEIIGILTSNSEFAVEQTQRDAWIQQIMILKSALMGFDGKIYFEYTIPRMGKRIDTVCIIGSVIFILEFKIGEKEFNSYDIDQVIDYALDLKNFHETSHDQYIAPMLIASNAPSTYIAVSQTSQNDKLLSVIKTNSKNLRVALEGVLSFVGSGTIEPNNWEAGGYHPTPTIVEAAMALYRGHSVEEISRSDASAINLQQTTDTISQVIRLSKENNQKAICFVTGVPGAGKTLVGLNVATVHIDKSQELYSVFLSGNGPLVAILREALTRDRVAHEKSKGIKTTKSKAMSEVKMFIQNDHNFRDDCLVDEAKAPVEHVVLFDEAQRAWNIEQTKKFMKEKKNKPFFIFSEPEFLISCLDRHKDWAVIVCLVGGGQEINTGEAGISEWLRAIDRTYPDWNIYISSRLSDSEYSANEIISKLARKNGHLIAKDELHLSVSMRSFRAENVSLFVKQLLDMDVEGAQKTLRDLGGKYPIVLSRDLSKAKRWLKDQARGSERYGIIVSSQAERLRPLAIHVKSPMDPVHWFLDGKEDVRSSYYLEDVATEFDIQGLELDWACVTWDADFRFTQSGWTHKSFVGNHWNNINKEDKREFQKNAYRVLLTRARQGMVIVVPEGDVNDPTRNPDYYDPTYKYLKSVGIITI
jgi:hypothetical protein